MCSLISIIIPCYNCERYFSQLFNTLTKQTYSHWEAICIDDGSTDNTEKLLTEYARKDNRIKYFYQTNQGAAKARAYGISKASGEFITFLDADDTLSCNALEKFLKAFADADTDIVVSGFNIIKQSHLVKSKRLSKQKLHSVDYLKKVLCGKYGWELWTKMYRRKLFDNSIITPEHIRIGEDASVFIQLVSYAKNIQVMDETLYNYIQYESSASHVQSSKYAEETLQAGFFIEDILKQKDFHSEIKNEIDAMCLLFLSNSTRKAYLERIHPLVQKVYKQHCNRKSLNLLPLSKRIYLIIYYFFGKFISLFLFK